MFGIDNPSRVTIRRPKAGSLSGTGRPTYEQLLDDAGDAVLVRCTIEERGRRILDARGGQVQTDATLIYNPAGLAVIQKGDIVVRDGNQAYEVMDHESVTIKGTTIRTGKAGLIRTEIPVQEDLHGR